MNINTTISMNINMTTNMTINMTINMTMTNSTNITTISLGLIESTARHMRSAESR